MAWDVNYQHMIDKIGETKNKSSDKWQLYYSFIKARMQKTPMSEKKSEKEREVVEKLRKIDRKVRAHEMAHLIAGGPYVRGGPYYKYITGPDGKRYAVAGEVKIDTSEEKDPEKTIRKMEVVRRAALAPADPSPTDRRVAAEASAKEARARMKLMEEKTKKFRKAMQKYQYTNNMSPFSQIITDNTSNNASHNPPIVGGIDINL